MRRWMKIGTGVAATVTTLLALFVLLQINFGFVITDLTGDSFCEGTYSNPCISEFMVKNPTKYDVDIYSKDQVKLDFSPEIYDYALFVVDGRCSATGSCACVLKDGMKLGFKGWRCVDFTNATKPLQDKVYNFRFPKYSETKFRLAGLKIEPSETIKWGFGVNDSYLDPFWYGTNTISFSTNVSQILMELGSRINISANLTTSSGKTVCIDVDHPSYGLKYKCGNTSVDFIFNVSFFRRDNFNDSSTTNTVNFNNGNNFTYYLKAHQYDDIINLTIDLRGSSYNGTYPTSVKIYINNTLSNSLGTVYAEDDTNEVYVFNDSLTLPRDTIFGSGNQTLLLYVNLPKYISHIGNATFNISGLEIGESLYDASDTNVTCTGDCTGNGSAYDLNYTSFHSPGGADIGYNNNKSTLLQNYTLSYIYENATIFYKWKAGGNCFANLSCYNYNINNWAQIISNGSRSDLVVSGTTSLCGNVSYDSIHVLSGGTISVCSTYLNLTVYENITIDSGGTITASGTGSAGGAGRDNPYCTGNAGAGSGAGSGGGYDYYSPYGGGGGGGAGYVGTGGSGGSGQGAAGGSAGGTFGSATDIAFTGSANAGSGGGASGGVGTQYSSCSSSGGNGGGAVRIWSPNIIIKGTIDVSGASKGTSSANTGGGGGGSGGVIQLEGDIINISGATLTVSGGTGGNGYHDNRFAYIGVGGGGGGSAGRIKIYYATSLSNVSTSYVLTGGAGGSGDDGASGASGSSGSYHVNNTAVIDFTLPTAQTASFTNYSDSRPVPTYCIRDSDKKLQLKWDLENTYTCLTQLFENNLSTFSGTPNNVSIWVGTVDSQPEFNITGKFNVTSSFDARAQVESYLSSCTAKSDSTCDVPVTLYSVTNGLLRWNSINATFVYDINPVNLDLDVFRSFVGNSTNFVNVPITFSSTKNGTLELLNLEYDYAGGNETINLLAYEENLTSEIETYTFNNSLEIENLTFTGNQNITRYLAIPYGTINVSSFYMNFSGFCLSYDVFNLTLWNTSLIDDTEIYEFQPDTNKDSSDVDVGGSGSSERWGLWKFNTTSLTGITGITVAVFKYSLSGYDTFDNDEGFNLSLHRIFDNSWVEESVTWNSKPSSYNLTAESEIWYNQTSSKGFLNMSVIDMINQVISEGNISLSIYGIPEDATISTESVTLEDKEGTFSDKTPVIIIDYTICNRTINSSLEIGTPDGTYEWNYTGIFDHSNNKTDNLADVINAYLPNCDYTGGYCYVPFIIHSDSGGVIQYSGISANFSTNIDIKTINDSIDAIIYYSKWDYNFPRYIDYLEFIPKSSTTKNVTPYGQSGLNPILNITTYNYGGRNMNISYYLNESYVCINLSASLDNAKVNGSIIINQSWIDFNTDLEYLNNTKMWMWADYACNYSYWTLYNPDLYLRGCCNDCVCSEDIQ